MEAPLCQNMNVFRLDNFWGGCWTWRTWTEPCRHRENIQTPTQPKWNLWPSRFDVTVLNTASPCRPEQEILLENECGTFSTVRRRSYDSKCIIGRVPWNVFCLYSFHFPSASQLRDVCVQDGSVWTEVWRLPPRFLSLQQHRLSTVSVLQSHHILPPTVWWVADDFASCYSGVTDFWRLNVLMSWCLCELRIG